MRHTNTGRDNWNASTEPRARDARRFGKTGHIDDGTHGREGAWFVVCVSIVLWTVIYFGWEFFVR